MYSVDQDINFIMNSHIAVLKTEQATNDVIWSQILKFKMPLQVTEVSESLKMHVVEFR